MTCTSSKNLKLYLSICTSILIAFTTVYIGAYLARTNLQVNLDARASTNVSTKTLPLSEKKPAVSKTFKIKEGKDDIWAFRKDKVIINSKDLVIGRSGSLQYATGIRFQDVNIPKDAEILSADLEITPIYFKEKAKDATLEFTLYAIDSANSLLLTGDQLYQEKYAPTSVKVSIKKHSWTPKDEQKRKEGIKAILQYLVNKEDWQDGNAITLILKQSADQEKNTYATLRSFESSPNLAPRLTVVYAIKP